MAWQRLKPSVIEKCWQNIFKNSSFEEEDDEPLARHQEVWSSDKTVTNDTIELLQIVEPAKYCTKDIEEWNEDVIIETDLGDDVID
ncbi:hypothetical protein JTB14_006921 [Gonioctena quinquepunctata]|nr:hypothetical protein JTB14_006921 [Gonioctena quinquepunctata]